MNPRTSSLKLYIQPYVYSPDKRIISLSEAGEKQ